MSQTPSTPGTASDVFNMFSSPTVATVIRGRQHKSIHSQLATTTLEDLPLNASFDDLPRIFSQGRTFVNDSLIYKKRKRVSWVQSHGSILQELDLDGSVKGLVWVCRPCDEIGKPHILDIKATTSAARHLEKHHAKFDPEKPSKKPATAQGIISMDRWTANTPPTSKRSQPVVVTTGERFKDALVAWILWSKAPFLCVEHETFREMLHSLN
jgi:hypothetical protein